MSITGSLQALRSAVEDAGRCELRCMGQPPTFGCVRSGKCEIFLCQGAQRGRGNGGVKMTFGPDGIQTADKGCLAVDLGE